MHIQARREDAAGRPATAKQKADIALGLNIGAIVIHLVLVPIGIAFGALVAKDGVDAILLGLAMKSLRG